MNANGLLLLLCLLLVVGLVPSLVREDVLHRFLVRISLSEKTNLDRIYDELNDKMFLVEDFIVSDSGNPLNCNSTYYFVSPVSVFFDIDSYYNDCRTYKEFRGVDTLNLFALNGDVECQVRSGEKSKSVFLFPDTHRLRFRIEEE